MSEPIDLAVFDPIKALTVKMQEEDAALQIDHTTQEGEKELRSYVRTVRGYRSGLEKIRVRAKANSLEYGQAVDKMAKELKAPFDTVITERMKPLDEIEDVKRKAAEAIVEAELVATKKAEAEKAAELKRREEVVARKEAELKVAEDAANAEQQAADRVIREKRIADEAAETAKKLAEANAAKQAEALKKSIQDNADRRERIRLEEIESKAAVVRMDAEVERRRVANQEHRAKVEQKVHKVLFGIITYHVDDNETKARKIAEHIVTALKENSVPHITIKY